MVIWCCSYTTVISCFFHKSTYPRDPITLSDDEQGAYNHLRNGRYLASMLPFSVSVSQDP